MIQLRSTSRVGFTLVELLVVISIIGLLIAMLLPAVQAAREASRLAHCKNNMKQVAMSILMHEHSKQYFPPARLEPHPEHPWEYYCGGFQPTWYARILPYMELESLAKHWRLDWSFYGHPEPLRMTVVPTFLCPSRRSSTEATVEDRSYDLGQLACGCAGYWWQKGGALGDYGANHGDGSGGASGLDTDFYHGGNGSGVLISARTHCNNFRPGELIDKITAQEIEDGLSNTLLLGEKHIPFEQYGLYPYDSPIFDGDHLFASSRVGGPGYPIGRGPQDDIAQFMSYGSWHPQVCNMTLGDGSVRSVSPNLDTVILGNLCNRADGGVTKLP